MSKISDFLKQNKLVMTVLSILSKDVKLLVGSVVGGIFLVFSFLLEVFNFSGVFDFVLKPFFLGGVWFCLIWFKFLSIRKNGTRGF